MVYICDGTRDSYCNKPRGQSLSGLHSNCNCQALTVTMQLLVYFSGKPLLPMLYVACNMSGIMVRYSYIPLWGM